MREYYERKYTTRIANLNIYLYMSYMLLYDVVLDNNECYCGMLMIQKLDTISRNG